MRRLYRGWWQLAVIAVFGLVVVITVPRLLSVVWLNSGMLALRNGVLISESYEPGAYPFCSVLDEHRIHKPVASLQRAVDWNPRNHAALWALGRALLGAGEAGAAFRPLSSISESATQNALMYRDLLFASSFGDQPRAVIDLYRSTPLPYPTQTMSDTVALAYLQRSSNKLSDLVEVRRLRPSDLYSNYHLWQTEASIGDAEASAVYVTPLTHFSLEGVSPTEVRLISYVAEIVPSLLEEGIWDTPKALAVTSFLVWQHSDMAAVEHLLQELAIRYPDSPEWYYYLGELHQRQGDLGLARSAYLLALKVAPHYASAYFRMALIAEAMQSPGQAVRWYRHYHRLAPDDVWGLQRLVALCGSLSCRDATELQAELVRQVDGRAALSERLDVSKESVTLGPSLVGNGDFAAWADSAPSGWRQGTYLGQSGNEGLYVVDEDTLVPGREVTRISALWTDPALDGAATYGEYIGDTFTVTNTRYLVSLNYASQYSDGVDLLYLGEYTRVDGYVLVHAGLPDTNGRWVTTHMQVSGPSSPTVVTPVVRNWGAGQLLIGGLEIRPVICLDGEC